MHTRPLRALFHDVQQKTEPQRLKEASETDLLALAGELQRMSAEILHGMQKMMQLSSREPQHGKPAIRNPKEILETVMWMEMRGLPHTPLMISIVRFRFDVEHAMHCLSASEQN